MARLGSKVGILGLAPMIAALACGGGNGGGAGPSTPAIGPCQSISCTDNTPGVVFSVNAFTTGVGDGPFTYTFAGIAVSGSGRKTTQFIGLTPGDYEASGQMMTHELHFAFNNSGGFGAQSVQVLEGPVPATLSCNGFEFRDPPPGRPPGNPPNASQPASFKFRLRVGSKSGPPVCLN